MNRRNMRFNATIKSVSMLEDGGGFALKIWFTALGGKMHTLTFPVSKEDAKYYGSKVGDAVELSILSSKAE